MDANCDVLYILPAIYLKNNMKRNLYAYFGHDYMAESCVLQGIIMKKTTYSIVLNKDVIGKIDNMAFLMNTNRSNLINNILSEYVSIETPQNAINHVFEVVRDGAKAGANLQLEENSAKSVVVTKSALKYKYNPSIKYILGMYYDKDKFIGSLKIMIRTQNEKLITLLEQFFNILEATEKGYIDFKENSFHKVENGKLERIFVFPNDDEHSSDKIGSAVFNYMDMIDGLIKIYFRNFENLGYTVDTIDKLYKTYIQKCEIVV